VHEIRSKIRESQGKSWVELNIGQMGHTANITWASITEHDATDAWVQLDLEGCSAKYTHRIAGGDTWDSTGYTFDINKRTIAKEIFVNGRIQIDEKAKPNGQVRRYWRSTLEPIGVEPSELPATLEPLMKGKTPTAETLEHWETFKELWTTYL